MRKTRRRHRNDEDHHQRPEAKYPSQMHHLNIRLSRTPFLLNATLCGGSRNNASHGPDVMALGRRKRRLRPRCADTHRLMPFRARLSGSYEKVVWKKIDALRPVWFILVGRNTPALTGTPSLPRRHAPNKAVPGGREHFG